MYKVENKLEKDDILNLYTKGCKSSMDFKVGIEYERLPINLGSFKNVDYWQEYGIKDFLETFAKEETWDYITDEKNIIGLKNKHDTLTLEPGCQLEISAKPERTVFEVKKKIEYINSLIKPIADKMNITFLNYGVSPYITHKAINLIPKKRYKIMARYLWGILSDVMMRETAGIQCCIDFDSEEDAMRKFKLANKLSPFMTAMFANSPIRGGVDTGYKSFRALSWLNTDNDRCGFLGKISEDFSFEEYIDCVLKTPMIFLNRDNLNFEVRGDITFEEFIQNGWEGTLPTLADYELHANLCFPEVRMRNFIEIRNHDCVGGDLKYAILAIYKGIMYNTTAMDECEELFKHLQYKDFSELRYNVPKNTLQSRVKKAKVLDYAKEIISIAEKSLKEQQTGESLFLDAIKEYTLKGLTPADVLIKNWNGSWNRDMKKLIRYLAEFD
ncbi:MAG: glutamate-cysteine ligase family protein [Muribaculaceae bacterium]|nr:glutamate-cysteine ligase family protein [Muribaculaceae bacterium]